MTGPARTRVVRVDHLVGVNEMATRYGVTRSAVCNWIARHRHFPPAVAQLACGSIYDVTDVDRWMEDNPPYHRN